MTMLTRCAMCHTAFRITTEQLVSRQGMVRCGQCSEVFNALDHLIADAATTPALGATQPEIAAASAGPDSGSYDLFGAPLTADPSVSAGNGGSASLAGGASVLLGPVTAARRFPWWSLAGALLAATALAVQGAWFYRDRIALAYPPSKPLLEAACAELQCKLELPVDASAISIESSDLQADPGSSAVLILSAVLRNRASFAQELPMLELALTDALDAPLARRVLKPAEYAPGAVPATIGAGSELQLRLFIDASQLKANGYRLYAFFP